MADKRLDQITESLVLQDGDFIHRNSANSDTKILVENAKKYFTDGTTSTVDSVIDLQNVDSSKLVDGNSFLLFEYFDGTALGGGSLVYESTRPKSEHNGGTVFSPTVPWDGLDISHGNYMAGIGENDPLGNGCFVRVRSNDELPAIWWGAKVDNIKEDDQSIQSAINYANSINGGVVTLIGGDYKLDNALILRSKVKLRGAGITTTRLLVTAIPTPVIKSPSHDQEKASMDGTGLECFWGGVSDLEIVLNAGNNGGQGINYIGMSRCEFRNIRVNIQNDNQKAYVMDSPVAIGAGGTVVSYNRFINCFSSGNLQTGTAGHWISHEGLGNLVTALRIESGRFNGLDFAFKINKGDSLWVDSVTSEDCTTHYSIGKDPEASFGKVQNSTISNPNIRTGNDGIIIANGAERVSVFGGFRTGLTGTGLIMPREKGHSCIGYSDFNTVHSGSFGEFRIENPSGDINPPRILGEIPALEWDDINSGDVYRIQNFESTGAISGGIIGRVNGVTRHRWGSLVSEIEAEKLEMRSNNNFIQFSSGSPEGVITANVGSVYFRTDGGASTTLYVKESGSGNTGWVAK